MDDPKQTSGLMDRSCPFTLDEEYRSGESLLSSANKVIE
jgi:hypothetical protein